MRARPTADPRCGTRAGYLAHLTRNERACLSCCDANTAHERDRKASHAAVSFEQVGAFQSANRPDLIRALAKAGAL